MLKLARTSQADIRLAASQCPAMSADVAKIDAGAKAVEAACESRGFQWCRGESTAVVADVQTKVVTDQPESPRDDR